MIDMLKCGNHTIYSTEEMANEAAEVRGRSLGFSLYTYQCNRCSHYHITKWRNILGHPFTATGPIYEELNSAAEERRTFDFYKLGSHKFELKYKKGSHVYNFVRSRIANRKHSIVVTAVLKIEEKW
jgi:hypothetical protein